MNHDSCQVTVINQERIALAREHMADEATLYEVANTFKILGDITRVRIIQALATTELCVCDLAALLEMTVSAISHQLRLLRAHGIVRFRKEGKIAHYSLEDRHVPTLLDEVLRHVLESRGKGTKFAV